MDNKSIEGVRQKAEEAFTSGLYCAESVLMALSQAQGLDSDVVPRIATALCSGMSRTCGTCGALTGAVLGVSLALGRTRAEESVQPAYEATQKLIDEFEREFGARNCDDLLGCDLGHPDGQQKFRENKLHERCIAFTGKATEIAAKVIAVRNPHIEITDTGEELKQLLGACELPFADVELSGDSRFFGCRFGVDLVAVVGLEIYGSDALLRSLAVAPQYRNYGLGKLLIDFVEGHAAAAGVESLYLLTTTAEAYFDKHGYSSVSRAAAPPAIKASAQYSELCPATSLFMHKPL